jgi:hypothetical protein
VNIPITDIEDEISWGLSPSRLYTTSSLYRHLTSGGVVPKFQKSCGNAE